MIRFSNSLAGLCCFMMAVSTSSCVSTPSGSGIASSGSYVDRSERAVSVEWVGRSMKGDVDVYSVELETGETLDIYTLANGNFSREGFYLSEPGFRDSIKVDPDSNLANSIADLGNGR